MNLTVKAFVKDYPFLTPYTADTSGSKAVVVKNNLAFSVGCEEAPFPAESSGFKAVVVKNSLALRVGHEEAPCPAESSGFKAVVVKNSLALRVGHEEAPCPAESSGFKAVVVRTALSPVWDVKKLPFLPDLRPSFTSCGSISRLYLTEISGTEAVVVKNNLALRVGLDLCMLLKLPD